MREPYTTSKDQQLSQLILENHNLEKNITQISQYYSLAVAENNNLKQQNEHLIQKNKDQEKRIQDLEEKNKELRESVLSLYKQLTKEQNKTQSTNNSNFFQSTNTSSFSFLPPLPKGEKPNPLDYYFNIKPDPNLSKPKNNQ